MRNLYTTEFIETKRNKEIKVKVHDNYEIEHSRR